MYVIIISVVWNTDGAVRDRNVTTTEDGKFWKVLLPSKQSYYFQVV